MVYLAELDNEGLCIGIKQTNNFINDGNHVEISEFDDKYLNMKCENEKWVEGDILPEPEPEPIAEEIMLQKLEQLEQDALNKDELDLDRDILLMEIALQLGV